MGRRDENTLQWAHVFIYFCICNVLGFKLSFAFLPSISVLFVLICGFFIAKSTTEQTLKKIAVNESEPQPI